ncbi:MAG TPA: hypothetical protein VG755_46025 [Nannocystaceae bacterium]|nr:hypothetical protein [Nannocystaceae bacterium]
MRLHRCSRCRRHIRVEESRCPFCSVDTVARTTVTALTIGALGGCLDRSVEDTSPDTGNDTGTSTTIGSTSANTTSPTSTGTTNATSSTSSMDTSATIDTGDDVSTDSSSDDGWDTCVGFYGGCPPDGGNLPFECDIWAQDCQDGEKCMPWANDGTNTWNATRCSPLDVNPQQPGEPCTVEGSGVSGIDSCELGTMCWNVDPETNEGVCVDFCEGSEANPVCEDAATECFISNDGVLILCLPPCDPFFQGCGEGQGCYPTNDQAFFVCLPDGSSDSGAHGDPCNFEGDCDPGLFCADPAIVFDCMGSDGCCTEFCDVTSGDPDLACSGAANGETCVAWYDDGQAPPDLAHVGACVLAE